MLKTILNAVDCIEYPIDEIVPDINKALIPGSNVALTFDQAVLMHRLMWSWIYEEFCCGRKVDKRDFWEQNHLPVGVGEMRDFCFFCIYRNQFFSPLDPFQCNKCPGVWSVKKHGTWFRDGLMVPCCSEESPYSTWGRTTEQRRSELARQIAQIKIREKEEEDL